MTRIPIALQLHALRDHAAENFAATFQKIAAFGYEGVEFNGYHGHDARELRQMLDAAGLQCAGSHSVLDLVRGDELQKTIEFQKTLGNRFLIVPGVAGEYFQSSAKWLEFCREITEISERAREQDMIVGFHNHEAEFKELDGETFMEIFLKNTPQDVTAQFDLGNAMNGGGDCLPLMERYPGRAGTIHLKDYKSGDAQVVLGEGEVDLQRALELCESGGGTQWYIVDYGGESETALENVKRCLLNMKKLGR